MRPRHDIALFLKFLIFIEAVVSRCGAFLRNTSRSVKDPSLGFRHLRCARTAMSVPASSDPTRPIVRQFGRALVIAFALTTACNLAGLAVPLYNMELYNLVLNSRNI